MLLLCLVVFFFFFKQKTAYEVRISDWSSDVCSSDLQHRALARGGERPMLADGAGWWQRAVRIVHPGVARPASMKAHLAGRSHNRSEERRVGKECVSTCRSRGAPCH